MALKRLVEVSEGDEQKAQRIVEQSISRGWMDFYQLKQPSKNGKSSTAKLRSIKPTTDNLEGRVQSEIDKRYGNGASSGSQPHSKAV